MRFIRQRYLHQYFTWGLTLQRWRGFSCGYVGQRESDLQRIRNAYFVWLQAFSWIRNSLKYGLFSGTGKQFISILVNEGILGSIGVAEDPDVHDVLPVGSVCKKERLEAVDWGASCCDKIRNGVHIELRGNRELVNTIRIIVSCAFTHFTAPNLGQISMVKDYGLDCYRETYDIVVPDEVHKPRMHLYVPVVVNFSIHGIELFFFEGENKLTSFAIPLSRLLSNLNALVPPFSSVSVLWIGSPLFWSSLVHSENKINKFNSN